MKKQWKKEQKICSRCHDKPAISFKAGDAVVNTVDGYDLCPRCYRSITDRAQAELLALSRMTNVVRFPAPVLIYEPSTLGQVEPHRQKYLDTVGCNPHPSTVALS